MKIGRSRYAVVEIHASWTLFVLAQGGVEQSIDRTPIGGRLHRFHYTGKTMDRIGSTIKNARTLVQSIRPRIHGVRGFVAVLGGGICSERD